MLIANEHINLNNCSITGLAESRLQEEFAPSEGEIPSYGLVALFGAEVDMLNCDISKCQGEWEIADGILTGFGREIELPTGIPSVAVITDMDTASANMIGCTISDNDLGILAIPVMELPDELGGDLLGFSDSIAGGFFSIDDFGWDGNGGSLLANMNNIAGNEYCGICNAHNETLVDATNNWWGSVNGPEWYPLEEIFRYLGVAPQFESASDNSGDIVVGNVTYEPWLGAPLELPEAYHESLGEGEDQVVNASKETGTIVTVTTTGATNMTIARYKSQPFPDEEFPDETLGKYIDIHVSNPENVTWPIYVELSYTDAEVAAAGVRESSLGLYYYQPEGSFHRCSDTGANPTLNFIWANVTEAEAACLAGSPFGTGGQPPPVGGEAYPVNKAGLILPWIALGMAVIAGATILWRRRRAQS